MRDYQIGDKTLHLALTGDGYFDIQDLAEGGNIIEKISPNTREAYVTTCRVAAILAFGGELQRRSQGYDAVTPVKEGEIRVLLPITKLRELKSEIINTILEGLKMETKDDAARDLVLEEINSKKK